MKNKKTSPHRPKSRLKRSARPLHKKLLFHPLSILMLLCAGVLLVTATFQSHAATYDVTATVPAPALTSPAVITYPSDQQHLNAANVTVLGTCPDDSYVKLYLNGQLAGIAFCNNGTFSVPVTLRAGVNELLARVFNITDSEGPASPPVTAYYDIPTAEPSQPRGSSPETRSGLPSSSQSSWGIPLAITLDYRYKVLYPGELWRWDIGIVGGAAPYKIEVDWHDGKTTTIDSTSKKSHLFTHSFGSSGIYHPLIKVTDQKGAEAKFQTLAIIRSTPDFLVAPVVKDIQDYLWIIWPAYIVITLMVASFWLGEFEVTNRVLRNRITRHRR